MADPNSVDVSGRFAHAVSGALFAIVKMTCHRDCPHVRNQKQKPTAKRTKEQQVTRNQPHKEGLFEKEKMSEAKRESMI